MTITMNIDQIAHKVAQRWLNEYFGGSPEEVGSNWYQILASGSYLKDGDLKAPIGDCLYSNDVTIQDSDLSESGIENLSDVKEILH